MKIVIKKEKKPYEKWLPLAAAVILVIAAVIILRPKVQSSEVAQIEKPFEAGDVYREKSEIILDGFTQTFTQIKWTDNQLLTFMGHKDGAAESLYELDLNELSVNSISDEMDELGPLMLGETTVSDRRLLYKNEAMSVFYIRDASIRGIYSFDEKGNYKKITEHMRVNESDEPYVLISENAKKMLYLEDSTSKMVTYDFETHKKKIISHVIEDSSFYNSVSLSASGGYILESVQGAFNCFGSDSGKQYVDMIEGINPIFSKNGNYVYYLYAGSMENHVSGKRIGVISLDKANIEYLTAADTETYFHLYKPIDENRLFYFTGVYDEGRFIIDEIVLYNPDTDEKNKISTFKGTSINSDCEYDVSGELLLLPEENHQLTVLNLTTQSVQRYADLMAISDDDVYVKNHDDYIICYSNTFYKLDREGKSKIYEFEGEYVTSSISPNGDKLMIISQDPNEDKLNVVVTYKLGNTY